LKKNASSSKDEIRAEIFDRVRHQLLPAMAEKFLPGKDGTQPRSNQKRGLTRNSKSKPRKQAT
jgi:hypothetical protein